jgi:hypothetical protein
VLEEAEGSTLNGLTGRTIVRRRRRLAGVVVMAIGCCAGILVAAAMAKVSRSKVAAAAIPSPTLTAPTASPVPMSPPIPASSGANGTTNATTVPTNDNTGATGTIVLAKPALRGHVWIDGQKVTTANADVSCGTHKVKVGPGRTHPVNVPCGGTVKLGR